MKTKLDLLLMVTLTVFAFVSVGSAQQNAWDQDRFNDEFDAQNTTIIFEDGIYYFLNDINIPGENNQGALTYTVEFEPGAEIYFAQGEIDDQENWEAGGSLTITTDNDDIGRISALGEEGAGNTVLFTGYDDQHWDGINVLSFPGGSNMISYCEVTNIDGAAIEIGTLNTPAKCVVEYSHIHDIGNWGTGIQICGPQNNGSDFSINGNVIHDTGWRGIQFDGGFNGNREDLAIVNNTIYDNPSDGIQLHNTFDRIWIASNIIYGNSGSQIQLWNGGDNPRVYNNTLDGQEIENVRGIDIDMAPWSNEICNNIIVNCAVGIRNTAGGNPEVDFQVIFNCDTPLQGCQDADEDIIEADPDFVNEQNGDYHLGFNSPAIDQGDNNIGIDLNFTSNDMGAYGGPLADSEMASLLFGTVVAGQHEVEVEAQVPEDYEYVVPDGVSMTMDELITVEADAVLDVGDATMTFMGSLTVNGEAEIAAGALMEFAANRGIYVDDGEMNVNGANGDLVTFRGINNGDWAGINFGNDGGHNSIIDFADVSGSSGYGIDWSGSFIDLLSNSLIHDNGTGILTALLNDDVEIEDCEIYDNDDYGVFGAEVAGTVSLTDCEIYGNGSDGVLIGGAVAIDGCEIYQNGHDGASIFYGDASVTNSEIYQNSYSGVRLTGWQGGNGTILVGAVEQGNHIHHNGQYGMYVTDIHFVNTCNIIENNPMYGIFVMGNFPAYFNTDHIRLNGPSTIGTGIGFNNGFAVMNHTSSDSNYFRGMEAWNLSWIDMAPPQNDPLWLSEDSSRFMNNGWTPQPPPLWAPVANVDEIYLGSQANIWIANGSCDIYDNRIAGGDRLISRNPNLAGVINGITCYFGAPPVNPNVAFNPWNLVTNFWQQQVPNYLNSFEEDEAAEALLARTTGAMRQGEFEDADRLLRRILTDYTETPSASNCPGLLQVCVRELGLDLVENREFLEELEVGEDNVSLLKSREQAVNMLLLYSGRCDEAVSGFTEVMENAESLQDSVEAALNVVYAEHIRDMQEDEYRIAGVGSSLDSKVTELLQLMHSDRPFSDSHPTEFKLASVYPNPFNSVATISYSVPEVSSIRISVHDLNGREIGVVFEGQQAAGNYSTVWKAENIASGIYVCRIKAGEHVQSTKMTLLR